MKTYKTASHFSPRKQTLLRLSTLLVLFLGSVVPTFAAQPPQPEAYTLDGTAGLLKWLIGCMVVIMFILAYIALIMTSKEPAKIIPNFLASFTGADQEDKQLEHAYDGIRELDNRMPSWLRLLFWGTIVFAGVYLLHYHVLGTGDLQEAEYEAQLAYAEEHYQDVEIPEDKIIAFTDGASLASGQAIFVENCASCHVEDGGGKTGPNLTDAYWKHGGGILNVYKTISNGVPQKGMIAWKNQLSSMQRLQVASYVLTFQGTTPANPKEPEGEIWVEGASQPEAANDSLDANPEGAMDEEGMEAEPEADDSAANAESEATPQPEE